MSNQASQPDATYVTSQERPTEEPLSLPALFSESLETRPPQLRRDGWWRRARAALRSAPTNFQDQLAAELVGYLRRPLALVPGPYMVATTSLKGGVGKTTVTACLGLALARYRPDRVLAADLNLHAGTLGDRLIPGKARATVQHLLDDLLDEATSVSTVGDIDRYIEVTDRLSVLVGDQDPSVGAAFDDDDISELLAFLGRFFHIILADCGTGIADDAMQAVLRETHTLVLVATPTPDAAGLADATLRWLDDHGYAHLVENSIAVLSGQASSDLVDLRTQFRGRCRAVIDIPADPHLARGRTIGLDSVTDATNRAYLALAAAVMDAAPQSSGNQP